MKTSQLSVFVSCAPEDEPYLGELDRHLASLLRKGTLSLWHPLSRGGKTAGAEAQEERVQALERADWMLLLQSRDYFASPLCLAEMQRALARKEEGKLRIARVLLRACEPPDELLSLACIPHRGEPIYHWASHDDFWNALIFDLRRLMEQPKPSES